jgi:hypothetical protein
MTGRNSSPSPVVHHVSSEPVMERRALDWFSGGSAVASPCNICSSLLQRPTLIESAASGYIQNNNVYRNSPDRPRIYAALPKLYSIDRRGGGGMYSYTRGRISLWLYKENKKLRDWKKCIYSTYSPLSSTHLWLRCSNFFNTSTKNSFGCAANRKIGNRKSQRLISTATYKL